MLGGKISQIRDFNRHIVIVASTIRQISRNVANISWEISSNGYHLQWVVKIIL